MKKAFSLIELLVSLIIISVITAVFIPVFTSKLKRQNAALSSSAPNCKKYGDNCALCNKTSCMLCSNQLNLSYGYYINPDVSCDKKSCIDFDAQCKNCTKEGCQECNSGYVLDADKKCSKITCSKGYYIVNSTCQKCPENYIQPNDASSALTCSACLDNQVSNAQRTQCSPVICLSGQYQNGRSCFSCQSPCSTCFGSADFCTSCIGGYSLVNNKCRRFTDVPCLQVGNICAAKFNAGDYQGLSVPESLVLVSGTVYSNYFNNHQISICWKGQTSTSCNYDNGSYSGCFRTVCTYSAAEKICQYHGWRLPTSAELSYFAGFSIGLGERGLQLCDTAAGRYSPQCLNINTCPNSYSGCYPAFIWAQGRGDYVLSNGSFVFNTADSESWALSVRCVRDL